MSFELVQQLQQKAVPVDQACRMLEVSRSGYSAVRQRSQVAPAVCADTVELKAEFTASDGSYGSPRLRMAGAPHGMVMGRLYRVRCLMRQHGCARPGSAISSTRPTANTRCRSQPMC